MKVFTIDRSGVEDGVIVNMVTTPAGYRIPVVAVGEEGRGRQLAEIPVRLLAESWKVWNEKGEVRVKNLSIKHNRLGDMRFEECYPGQVEDEYLVVFRGWIGFRGWNRLELLDGRPLPADMVIAQGRIAQGEAGRMGAGDQWILKVHQGDLLRFTVGGRLYGEPGDYVVVCSASKPVLYPETLYKVGRAYDE